jgi:hypothetical protein
MVPEAIDCCFEKYSRDFKSLVFLSGTFRLENLIGMAQEEGIDPSAGDPLAESSNALVQEIGSVDCCVVCSFLRDPVHEFLFWVRRKLQMSPARWRDVITAKFRACHCGVAEVKRPCNGPY